MFNVSKVNIQHSFVQDSNSIITTTIIIASHPRKHATHLYLHTTRYTSSTPPTLAHLQRKRATPASHASRNSMPFLKINWKEQNTLKKRNVWTVKVKAEAHLEPTWASTVGIYSKNGNQLSAIFPKKLQHKCSIEFYIRLSKEWNFARWRSG